MSAHATKDDGISNDISNLLNQLTLARREIHNLRQQLTSLKHVYKKDHEYVYQKLKNWQCSSCKLKQNSHEYTEPTTSVSAYDYQSKYIGIVNTDFPEKRGTPRQPAICGNMKAKLTLDKNVFTNPCHSLEGLQEFSHMWILFHFHKNKESHVKAKVAPPRLDGIRSGVFATRSPHRPNPIGLSLVKIDKVMGGTIYFSGVDMVNDTPVLDIKPYIPQYDNPSCFNNTDNNHTNSFPGNTSIDIYTSSVGEDNMSSSAEISANTSLVSDGEEMQGGEGASIAEESFHMRSDSRIGEREAPDGEEGLLQNPQAPLPAAATPEGQIRVPSWINRVPSLTVLFSEIASMQLDQLGSEVQEKKTIITNILREDPRSIYMRKRWKNHCFVFRIAELYVSCRFNESEESVTVYQVLLNGPPAEGEVFMDLD